MRFGLFGSAQARRPGPGAEMTDSSQGFREWIENNVEAEALGFHSTFVVEHHFTGFGQVSASLNLLTWLGARTSTLRLGTAVLVLPWHNPVLLAEQAATSTCCPAAGSISASARAIATTSSRASASRWRRPTRASTRRWRSSPNPSSATSRSAIAASTGNTTTSSSSRPRATRPHPPFWMGAGSERSVRQVAERGYNLLLGQYDLAEDVVRHVAQFKADVEKRGRRYDPMEVGIARAIHFADTKEELEAAQIRRFQGHVRINNLSRRPDGDDRDRFAREDEAEVRRLCDETAIFGTPDDIARKLEKLRDGGVEYVLINFGGSRENIRRFARDIMPAFAAAPRDKRARDGQAIAVAAK